MASINTETNGHRRIQFVAPDGKRPTIRLGNVTERQAEAIRIKVEELLAASITGHAPSEEVSHWVARLPEKLADRLASVGLIQRRRQGVLGDFVDGFIADRLATVKASTATVYGHTRRNLLEHFGRGKKLRDITPGDADAFELFLRRQGLADNTIRRRLRIASQFMRSAHRLHLLTMNPFAGKGGTVRSNRERVRFITRETAERVLAACPDAQWRLIFGLCRYGGLRCPSEVLGLRWSDVDWERSRFTVRATKTEHHDDGGVRIVPIFVELLPLLRDVFEQAPAGSEFVITGLGRGAINLGTQMQRIIARAGVEPWPKTFQNLRSTRQTELADIYPAHAVCYWIGNSQAIAREHYLQVTEDHYAEAAATAEKSDVKSDVANAGNRGVERQGEEVGTIGGVRKCPENSGLLDLAVPCRETAAVSMGDGGLEPSTSRV